MRNAASQLWEETCEVVQAAGSTMTSTPDRTAAPVEGEESEEVEGRDMKSLTWEVARSPAQGILVAPGASEPPLIRLRTHGDATCQLLRSNTSKQLGNE